MKVARLFLFGAALLVSVAASAQYQWIDKDGRRVFSDRAPPADVPAKNILQEPRSAPAAPSEPVAAPEPTAATAPASAPPQTEDKALEAKKQQAEAAEQARKKAEEAKQTAAQADNCQRARNAKATLDSGLRMVRVNDKGEREVLDDAQRAAELKRVNAVIAADCK